MSNSYIGFNWELALINWKIFIKTNASELRNFAILREAICHLARRTTAAEVGFRLFDCASVYGNEHLIGEVFEDIMKSGIKREELFITSKVWNDMHGKGDVMLSCAKTLKDLRLDYCNPAR